MSPDALAEFKSFVLESKELPAWAAECVDTAHGVETRVLDKSYLEFLDDMILREPRGPDWTKVLKKRRSALAVCLGNILLSGLLDRPGEHIYIVIDQSDRRLVYWEVWPLDSQAILK